MVDAGVTVLACRNSLDGHEYDAADLLDGVSVVPTAMGEFVRRQATGAAYVRP
jgi:intracellular sulfur oxidation DsrE/DsrF family protein